VNEKVRLPVGYRIDWEGEYESRKRADARLLVIVPLTIFLIFMIIYGTFGSAKWACLNLVNMAVAGIGGLLALVATGTHFSVSSGVGFLALFGASVQIGVIVGGLIADLALSVFLLPTFYVWWARPTDPLPKPEGSRSIDAGDNLGNGQ